MQQKREAINPVPSGKIKNKYAHWVHTSTFGEGYCCMYFRDTEYLFTDSSMLTERIWRHGAYSHDVFKLHLHASVAF